jgi:Carboxypeptidase regulatory-like domain
MSYVSRIPYACLALLVMTLAPGFAGAQTTAGSINGQVVDPSGAPVPQANVTVTNKDNHEQRSVQTTSDGTYTLPNVSPGTYEVTASASGFSTTVSDNIQVLVNSSALVNMSLKVGNVNERIEVHASAPLLQTENPTIGEVIDNRQVVQLPLNGRQFTQLILLTPGAAYMESGQQSAFTIRLGAGGISPAVNGQNFTYNITLWMDWKTTSVSIIHMRCHRRRMPLKSLSFSLISRMPGLGWEQEQM